MGRHLELQRKLMIVEEKMNQERRKTGKRKKASPARTFRDQRVPTFLIKFFLLLFLAGSSLAQTGNIYVNEDHHDKTVTNVSHPPVSDHDAATKKYVDDKALHTVTFTVDGAGTVLTAGTKNPIKIPFGGTLQGWVMTCKPSGSVTADVYRAADGAGLPVTSIVGGGGTKPAIASNVENSSVSFTSWTSTTLTAKDNLAINLSGITTATYVQLTLYYK